MIERIQGRTNLPTDFGLWVDVLKSVDQRGIFSTQLFSQFVHFLKQRIEFLGVTRLISLLHLVTELGHLAIDWVLALSLLIILRTFCASALVTFAGVGF